MQGDGTGGYEGAGLTRRAVVTGAGVAALSTALAGCEVYGGSSNQNQSGDAGGRTKAGGEDTPTSGGAAAGGVLTKIADVPVGGGKILEAQKIVVTQPTKGEFRGFSAVCTHQGCTVASVAGGTINCPCHGSKFAITDGSVRNGPAPSPLPGKTVRVEGDSIVLA